MKKIKRLSETAINQIAAGEVVENPASVIKELIENSLDANAKQISIGIEKGGHELIFIEDDGDGMSPEDAVFSLERHATSKIEQPEDLSSLSTMGFRGEALAAITSVSKFEIKTSNGVDATQIRGEAGVVEEVIPTARNRGTSISIHSLFFNTPARQKFQKSVGSSTSAVTKVVELLAMANPEVSFSYTSQGELIYSFEPESQKERVEKILGPFEFEAKKGKFWGLFGSPKDAKPRRRQFLFINKRPVFSPLIARAIQTAYGMRLEKNMYPSFALFLNLDPKHFDINVHPQKKEVRFSKESALFSQVEGFTSNIFTPARETAREPIFLEERPSFLLSDVPHYRARERQEPFQFELKPRPVAILGAFFLFEKEGLFLVSIERARSRIFFEEMKKEAIQSQSLLIPIEVEESDPEVVAKLQKIGFECRQISPRKIAIDALVSSMDQEDFDLFFDAWKQGKSLEEISIQVFRKGKKHYCLDEAMHIFETLQKCETPEVDPLGNRIWKRLEPQNLEQILD